MKDLRPVVVRGLVTAGVARVVVDEARLVVVTVKDARGWLHDGQGLVPVEGSLNRFTVTVPGESEVLTVVRAGGCTCGKPWLKSESGVALLDRLVGVVV
jgi:hypothetical protein